MISSRTPFTSFSKPARFVSVFLTLILFATPLLAQRPGGTQAKPSPSRAAQKTREIAFETLLSEDSYKVYGEVRNVGQLLSTGGAGEIVEPIMKLADPPSEFKALIKFLNANAETLAASRLMFAMWPARTGIPSALVAIELPSAEEAEKFEPKLNRVLPSILPTPTPTPTPTPSPTPIEQPISTPTSPSVPPARKPVTSEMPGDESNRAPQATLAEPVVVPVQTNRTPQAGRSVPQVAAAPPEQPAGPPFVVTRSGSLIFVTDKPFKFAQLRPADSKLLSEDQNFRLAHDRFSAEPVFIYVNVALDDKTRPKPPTEQEIAAQEEARIKAEEEARAEAEKNAEPAASETPEPMPEPEASREPDPTSGSGTVQQQTSVLVAEPTEAEAAPTPTQSQQLLMAASSQVGTLFSLLFSGESEWPDAVGVAISQETDSYMVRAILIGPPNARRLTLPFVPQLIAGRGFTPSAPSVLPDDTEVFVSASFDLPRTYESMLAQFQRLRAQDELTAQRIPAAQRELPDAEPQPAEPFVEFEKKGALKIKDDLLPVLGSEIAIAGSLNSLQGFGGFAVPPLAPPSPSAKPSRKSDENSEAQKKLEEAQAAPILLISIKDREAARRLMPRVMDGLGVGEARLVSRTDKRDDTELVDFAGVFAYAFVGDFLIISTTAAARRLIDSYLSHQTLSSNSAFRNFTRWQPRDGLGQIYISPALMDSYQKSVHDPSVPMPSGMREFLMRLNPMPQAITYAMSNDGLGATHELHVPKAFVLASVAGAASYSKEPPPEMNEEMAISSLRTIVSAEEAYKATAGNGSYGSREDLVKQTLISKEMLEKYGYNIQLSASRDQFEATATPVDYGKTGRRSFFVDQSGVVRGDDRGGGPASLGDKPIR